MFRRFISQRLNSQESTEEQPPAPAPPAPSPASSTATSATSASGTTSLFSSIASNFTGGSTPTGTKGKSLATATSSLAEKNQQIIAANTKKPFHLTSFDGCIEACDALASSAAPSGRVDPTTGLPDCSVLISPDGDLLLIPQEQQTSLKDKGKKSTHSTASTGSSSRYAPYMQELLQSDEEYESAMFRGTDLLPAGDKALNGFSAQGWSFPASSLALKQTEYAMTDMIDFVEDFVLAKKESATKECLAVEKLKVLVDADPFAKSTPRQRMKEFKKFLKSTFPEDQFELVSTRVGPINSTGGTIHDTIVALEQYFSNVTNAELNRWTNCQQQSGPIGKLRKALLHAEQRSSNRQKALQEMFQRANAMEKQLKQCKEEARLRWDAVHDAEEAVTKYIEEKMLERSRMKEKQRLEQLKKDELLRAHDSASGNFGATSTEIWDIVSAVAASMEEGSFEPMDLPQAPLSVPRDQSRAAKKKDKASGDGNSDSNDRPAEDDAVAIPIASRDELEESFGLPELRVAALAADEAVEEAGNALLTVLANMDATKRSARIAAETCLVSACNAQASCIKSLISMERKAMQERLKYLEELEKVAEDIDVRADLNHYITLDKKEEGGRSALGDDDDGGIASALGVLSSHIEGDIGFGSKTPRHQDSDRDWDDDDSASPEVLADGVEELFKDNKKLRSDAPTDDRKTIRARERFEKTVEMLCKTGNDRSSAGRSPRSTVCFALNAKRSSNARILTSIQFDGICRVFEALLNGCKTEHDSGVSIAKMCMMLSQTFYFDESKQGGEDPDDETDESRENRVYVKSRLVDHPLWQNDSFWCVIYVSESV